MKIGGLQKLTLLDFPERVACTVFTVGCNFLCPFCHNASLVKGYVGSSDGEMSQDELLAFLRKRKGVLEGLCLTGGEPLIQVGVAEFLTQVKSLGYKVKLDTNGAYPDKLQQLVELGLVDYVAMDVKNSKSKYAKTVGTDVDIDAITRSVEYLKSGAVDYEFRTTVTGTFHSAESIQDMAQWLVGAKRWYLQQFVDSGDLIDGNVVGCDIETMKDFLQIAQKYIPNTELRGVQ